MSIELRPITVDEYEEWMGAMRRGFGGDPGINLTLHHPVTGAAPWTEFDRSVVAIDGSEMVGTSHSYKLTIAVPGGDRLPLGGISHVCVQPTHTRRGILTSMMRMQLRDFHEWGEPLSALNASETIIYGRYGYSTACFREDWEIDRQYTAFTDSAEPRGHTEFIPSEKVGELFPEVFDRAMAGRPGVVTRTRAEWGLYVADPPQSRRGASAYFNVAYIRDGRIDGYAIYRVQGETLTVKELITATDEAYSALWRFCFSVDLRTKTIAEKRPLDDPMPWMLADPRRLRRKVQDNFWLRLVDARAALEGRTYRTEGSLVFEFTDRVCPWNEGRFKLEAGPDGARCTPTTESPDIVMSAKEMGSTYLGAIRFSTLARAGLVEEHSEGALERAGMMFSHELLPWAPSAW